MNSQALPVPLYQRIFGIILQRIRSGTYVTGQQLPNEQDLAAEFKVSKGTVREALRELADRGLIVRKQGSGTFVAETNVHRGFVGSFTDLISITPALKQRDLHIINDIPFPPDVRAGLETTELRGRAIRRIREVDDQVFSYSLQYLSPAVADIVTERELARQGMLTLLANHSITLTTAEQSVAAALAEVDVSEKLQIEVGSAVLFARRVLLSTQGPVEVVHAWYRGDLYSWQSTLTFSWSKGRLAISTMGDVDAST